MGCFVENLCIAADFFGIQVKVDYADEINNQTPLVKISVDGKGIANTDQNHLLYYIIKRTSNRNKYEPRPIPQSFIKDIESLSSQDTKVSIVASPEIRNSFGAMAVDAQILAMNSNAFRQELSELMKPNFTNSKVGMPAFAFGMPLPLSIFASWMIKNFNMSKTSKKTDLELFTKHTPAYLVISSKKDSLKNWLDAGRVMERAWLTACKGGLHCAPNAAPIQAEKYRNVIKDYLGEDWIPHVFMRIGFSKVESRHTPRLNIEDILIK
jgi:hypothetical protein